VTVHVTPIANDDQATTPKDTPVAIDIGRNDQGTVDPATITVQPEHGSATIQPATGTAARRVLAVGGARYTPDAGFVGVDEFTYRICATGAPDLCDTAVVTITVTGGDTPPPDPTPTPTPEPEPTSTSQPGPTDPPGPGDDGSESGDQAAGSEDGLPSTGVDGLGTIVFAALAITGLGVACLIIAVRVGREED
jgi:hypothetical protein